jgi:hypothetical protein
MITLTSGAAVKTMLRRATARPWNYSQILICSPFIDLAMVKRLQTLCEAAGKARSTVTIITNRRGGVLLEPLREGRRCVRLLVRDRLHTKAYLLLGRNGGCESEALVTSANLTRAGTSRNHELGVHIQCTTANGRALIHQLNHCFQRLTSQ